jgi:hypothetical protein
MQSFKGKSLDAVIITQIYHALENASALQIARASLDGKEGSMGLLWHRAKPAVRLFGPIGSAPTCCRGITDRF